MWVLFVVVVVVYLLLLFCFVLFFLANFPLRQVCETE